MKGVTTLFCVAVLSHCCTCALLFVLYFCLLLVFVLAVVIYRRV